MKAIRHQMPAHTPPTPPPSAVWLFAVALPAVISTAVLAAWYLPAATHWATLALIPGGVALLGLTLDGHLRGGPFAPQTLVGFFGLYFFYVGPLLQLGTDTWMRYPHPPADWHIAAGWTATLNSLSLLLMLLVYYARVDSNGRRRTISAESHPNTLPVAASVRWRLLILFVLVGTAAQVAVYWQTHGVLGFVQAVTARHDGGLEGLGVLITLAQGVPSIFWAAFCLLATHLHNRRTPLPRIVMIVAFLVFLVLLAVFGGLRSSRSAILIQIVAAAGMYHVIVRRLRLRTLIVIVIAGLFFLYGYAFYKALGIDTIRHAQATQSISELEELSGKGWEVVAFGDLTRFDAQVYLLDRESENPERAWGRTYLGAIAGPIPRAIWPDKPVGKLLEGTDAIVGPGAYSAGLRATRIFGLTGEAILNFGPLGVPAVYMIFGLLLVTLQRLYDHLSSRPGLSRAIAPFCGLLAVQLLTADSDNTIMFTVTYGIALAIPLWVSDKATSSNDPTRTMSA